MEKFIPRVITAEQAAQGYNNEGRGELLGYLAEPRQHDVTCRYRITCDGDRDRPSRESCTCRLGLWQDKTPTQKVVDEMRKTRKFTKKAAKPKPKAKAPSKRKAKAKAKPSKKTKRK